MRKALFASMLLLIGSPVVAADTAQCDATPFTLGKPAQTAQKAKAQPASTSARTEVAAVAPKKAAPKPKSRLIATCKDDKGKKSG